MTRAQKNAVRAATNAAIKAGILTRQPCEVCGSRGAHAHHVDYSDHLNIKWLCHRHHVEEHRRLGTLGRPPRAEEASTERVEIRATAEEREEWIARARAAGVSLSTWFRTLCNGYAKP